MTKDVDTMLLGSVQISGERISKLEMTDICKSLDEHNVRLLALRDCRTGENDFQSLVRAVGSCKSILHLNLNLGMVNSTERAQALERCLGKNRSLNAIFLHGSPISGRGVRHILNGLALHPNVVSLDLGDCQLTDSCVPLIADLLPPNGAKRGLKELTLSGNPGITSRGWTHLFMGISSGSSLRILNLDYNRIGCYGAGCLAVALAANRTLETVDLEGCGIEEFGAKALLKLIENYPINLKQLILAENKISKTTIDRVNSGLSLSEPEARSKTINTEHNNVEVEINEDTDSMSASLVSSPSHLSHQIESKNSQEGRNLNVIIREPTNICIITDIPKSVSSDSQIATSSYRSVKAVENTTPIPIIRTEAEISTSQDSDDVFDTDSGRSDRNKHFISSNYYSSSPGYNKRYGVVQSSSRNTYESMSTGEAVHAAYRKALQRKKRSK